MSTVLPKMGILLWVEIAAATSHDVLTVEDDGRVIVTDTLTRVPDGRGGYEPLIEEITLESVAEAVAATAEGPPGAGWKIISACPGLMPE